MVLLFDVGNTHTTLAVTEEGKNFSTWRISTKSIQTEDELYAYVKSLIKVDAHIERLVISSVVPQINHVFEFFSKKYLKSEAIFVDARRFPHLTWNVKFPEEIGADRVANVIASWKDYGKDCIIVDFGTATTIEILRDGVYEGGSIIPGFYMMINALFKGTAKLPMIEIKPFSSFVGKDTESNIKIGVINTVLGGIRYAIDEIKKELNFPESTYIILTGGQALLVENFFRKHYKLQYIFDQDLTLRGIYYFYESVINKSMD
ncbi:type III pantothenate kinase [Thermosipho ferrireducens]|uniref:Type III pantothenate kinase n=1 Tax=Thermosipho ferrireducens TaxID=2571116 RepID=A0ABX7S7S8_9BACT|nr:type III pantothenate kinase [Thermosipho ferrireducens]QTA37336.1 type III pantothenate kinase [Thermosipho ferrireducens]